MIYDHKTEEATVKRKMMLDKCAEWHWFCRLKVYGFACKRSIYNPTLSSLKTEANPKTFNDLIFSGKYLRKLPFSKTSKKKKWCWGDFDAISVVLVLARILFRDT